MSTVLSQTPDVSLNISRAEASLQRRIRILLCGFIIGLVLSGLTAFPLVWEVSLLARWLGVPPGTSADGFTGLTWWIVTVRNALLDTNAKYPFLAYGTDWLAFAHLVIATAFIGPLKNPVRNIWVLEWAMIACLGVIPLALICGPLRGIPFGWRLIDCSFGMVGVVPLWICRSWTKQLEALQSRGA